MAATPAALYRGSLSNTTTTTLYTATAATTVTSIVACNRTAASHTITLDIDGVMVLYAATVEAGQTLSLDLKQHIAAGSKTIRGGADAGSAIDLHISGVTW